MKYAKIIDGVVYTFKNAKPAEKADMVKVPDNVSSGWTEVDGKYSPPKRITRIIEPVSLINEFTDVELAQLAIEAKSNSQVDICLRLLLSSQDFTSERAAGWVTYLRNALQEFHNVLSK